MTNNEKAILVCLYYSQLRSDNPYYSGKCYPTLRLIATKYGFKFNTLRNKKDEYDSIFENGRKGYHKEASELQDKFMIKIYEKYKNFGLEELKKLVDKIISESSKEGNPYFSINIKSPTTVGTILEKKQYIEVDGLNSFKEFLDKKQPIFIVLGGDKPSWDIGLIGIGIISKEPYDVGYYGDNYKIQLDIKLLFDNPIKREDLIPYRDTYGIIGIGPAIKPESNQIINMIPEKNAVALMRAILEINPNIESILKSIVNNDTIKRIKGATTKFVPVEVDFGEKLDEQSDNISDFILSEEAIIYGKNDFLTDVFMSEFSYETICRLIENKKNIILQGPPGVGKTFVAKRLAYSILGTKSDNFIKMVQFHQSYSYEDFVMGFRAIENGFKLSSGPFYDFCLNAQKDSHKHFFIIDEINRGNLSKIFGELLMLIEADKRLEKVTILYKNEEFSIPENVYIIGTMNTADRSLAIIDYALRRRFSFFEMTPAFDSEGFNKIIKKGNKTNLKKLIKVIIELNQYICNDDLLGKGFQIGHSYFCLDTPITNELLNMIVEYDIIPMIYEYWFDEQSKFNHWSEQLRGALI